MPKFKEDQRVQTNDAYAALFGKKRSNQPPALHGAVLGPYAGIQNCWRVRIDGLRPVQHIHERFLEGEKKR